MGRFHPSPLRLRGRGRHRSGRDPLTLSAVYYDTADLRLMRWGVTLRHRSGEGEPWTLKLPDGDGDDDGLALVRREVTFDAPAGRVPAAAAAVVLSYLRARRWWWPRSSERYAPVST